ncbi:MAG TPA: undecaprenyldiphospho-muramoylpentapeptide beta-N-acetylglucosaminyltransferase [Kiritimatiellia bacterium]|nr:undecaprenyldiphospho-muramoylpentapeptide beta-N-acetylglucosaminyltransferase [Kiritimatiellia bacterium]
MKKLKIALACGGTGGHIFPGMATACVLRARGHEVTLWVAGKDVESTALAGWDGPVLTVKARGFPHGVSLKALGSAWQLLCAVRKCRAMMKKDRPDVVLAMGSYASVGPVGAARRLRIPVVLHESNVLPGRTNALFARGASAVAGCFEETRFYMKRKDIVLTGMPLRRELEAASAVLPSLPPEGGPRTVLIMGGSRGARRLNEVASRAVCELHRKGSAVEVIHLAGVADEKEVRSIYEEAGVPHKVESFIQNMAPVYQKTHLAICRSGAATCAELSAFGIPALLVPYPFASKDHQTANARAVEKKKAADVVDEKDMTCEFLVDYLTRILSSPDRLAAMSQAARKRYSGRGAEALADLVEQTAAGGRETN